MEYIRSITGKKAELDAGSKANRSEIKLSNSMVFRVPREEDLNDSQNIVGKYYLDPLPKKTKKKTLTQRSCPVLQLSSSSRPALPSGSACTKRSVIAISKSSRPASKYFFDKEGLGNDPVPIVSSVSISQSRNQTAASSKRNKSSRGAYPPAPFTLVDKDFEGLERSQKKYESPAIMASNRRIAKNNNSAIISMLRRNVSRDKLNQPESEHVTVNKLLFPKSTKALYNDEIVTSHHNSFEAIHLKNPNQSPQAGENPNARMMFGNSLSITKIDQQQIDKLKQSGHTSKDKKTVAIHSRTRHHPTGRLQVDKPSSYLMQPNDFSMHSPIKISKKANQLRSLLSNALNK